MVQCASKSAESISSSENCEAVHSKHLLSPKLCIEEILLRPNHCFWGINFTETHFLCSGTLWSVLRETVPFLVSKPEGLLVGTAYDMSPASIPDARKQQGWYEGRKGYIWREWKRGWRNWCQKDGMWEKHGPADTFVMSIQTNSLFWAALPSTNLWWERNVAVVLQRM